MSVLVINTQYVQVTPASGKGFLSEGFHGKFFITSVLDELGISENDRVIVASPEQNDLRFISEGKIEKVGKIEIIKPLPKFVSERKEAGLSMPKNKYEHHFELLINQSLKENNLLSDLEYSLKSVYSFNKPIVHFQQQFRDLLLVDYDTIVNGWIYAARTVFGKLVNAIPRQNKLEFMLQSMDHFSTVDFTKISLDAGLDFLYKYIDRRILSRGKLLVETNNLIKHHFPDIPHEEIGFINPKTEKFNIINRQASIFEKIINLESKTDLRRVIKKGISENAQLEYRFMEIFQKTTWPIDLKE